MKGQEVIPFDPQENQSIAAAFAVMRADPSIPKEVIRQMSGVLEAQLTGGTEMKVSLSNAKRVNHEVLSRTLEGYDILALKGTDQTYYIRPTQNNQPLSPIYEPIDREEFINLVTDSYEKVTGTVDGGAIDKICDSLDKKIRKERTIRLR